MDHDDDIRPRLQGHPVACLLVAAVTFVPFMDKHLRMGQAGGDGQGFITTCVIHEDDQIDDPLFHYLVVGLLKRLGRIVGRHDDDDLLILEHGGLIPLMLLVIKSFLQGPLMVRFLPQGGGVQRIGLREPCLIFHRQSEVIMGVRMVGIEVQSFAVFADGFIDPPLPGQNRSQICISVRKFRVGPDRRPVVCLRPFPIPLPEQRMGQVAMRLPDSRR